MEYKYIAMAFVAVILAGVFYWIGYFEGRSEKLKEFDDAPEPPDKCTCTYPDFCDKFCTIKADYP